MVKHGLGFVLGRPPLTLPAMSFRLPIRRFLQSTENTEAPHARLGGLQWVLTRPLYRFKTFDLAQVPEKNRDQALRLELAQWTPFADSGYFVGWRGSKALIWGWDAGKVQAAMAAQGIKPKRVQILPESLLQTPLEAGLCLTRCQEGFEGQLWRAQSIENSRWWPQMPTADEWLSFQRDAAIPPTEQETGLPTPRELALQAKPWLVQRESGADIGALIERPLLALGLLGLLAGTLWFGLNFYKVQQNTQQLREQQSQLQRQAAPLLQARTDSLDALARINALGALARYPDQLALMGRIAEVLPKNGASLKDWEYMDRQLKITLSATTDVPTTPIIAVLQQAGPFSDVKALPGRDPKSVMFQMNVIAP